MKLQIATLLLASSALSGCAMHAHCVGDFDYQRAYSLQQPDLQGLGIKMPTSSAAMVIPPPPAQLVPYAYKAPAGSKGERGGMDCLDAPPRLEMSPNRS